MERFRRTSEEGRHWTLSRKMAVSSRFGVRNRMAQTWGPGNVAIPTGPGEVDSGGFHYQMPSLPASTCSGIPQPQDVQGQTHTGIPPGHGLSAFPDPALPPHFSFTSLSAPSTSCLGLQSCSRLGRALIWTAGARVPLRRSRLCWGKYCYELQGGWR